MFARIIDLNCDLGECDDSPGIARDEELLSIVTSANIACGGHAGDIDSMSRAIHSAMIRGVAIGAHPALNDRAGFGRRRLDLPLPEVMRSVHDQIAAFLAVARRLGASLSHVKPHGGLYHLVSDEERFACAFAETVRALDGRAVIVARAGSPAVELWRSRGIACAAEAFIDRGYCADGTLLPREHPQGVRPDPSEAGRAAVRFARDRLGISADGRMFELRAQTLCIHSDSPTAVDIARIARTSLESAGVRVSSDSLGPSASA